MFPPLNVKGIPPQGGRYSTTTNTHQQTFPSANFRRYWIPADGDCLFRAIFMGLVQPRIHSTTDQQVLDVRRQVSDYVVRNYDALVANPHFQGPQGVRNLHDLLLISGRWDEQAGDLVAPLLSQVFGRKVVILQTQAGSDEYSVKQAFSPENPELPPGRSDTGLSTIYLLHVGGGTHYEYLAELDLGNNTRPFRQLDDNDSTPLPVGGFNGADQMNPTDGDFIKQRLANDNTDDNAPLPITGFNGADLMNPTDGDFIKQRLAKDNTDDNAPLPIAGLNGADLMSPTDGNFIKERLNTTGEAAINNHKTTMAHTRKRSSETLQNKEITASHRKRQRKDASNFSESHSRSQKMDDLGRKSSKPTRQRPIKGMLNAKLEEAMVQLWLQNSTWGVHKITSEFKKLHPETKELTQSFARSLKTRRAELQGVGGEKSIGKLTAKQEQAMIQLWLQNPTWGVKKITSEFKKSDPEAAALTRSFAEKLKARHPDLKNVGAERTVKKLTAEQEDAMAHLWLQNPSWSQNKIASEFKKQHPEVPEFSRKTVESLLTSHPDLQGVTLGGKKGEKKLTPEQEANIVQLWLQNPSWGERKITSEFKKRHPEAPEFSYGVAKNLKTRHPELQNQAVGDVKKDKKLTAEQEKAMVQLWLQNPNWGMKKLIAEFKKLHPEITVEFTFNLAKHLKSRHPELQGLSIGGEKDGKKLTNEQESALAQLWLQNPSWSENKIT